jgi:hypothetical protein
MTGRVSSRSPVPSPERFAGAPVVHHDGQWWLVSGSGSLRVADPHFTGELDRLATAMTAADQAIADSTARRHTGDNREPQ